MSSNLKTTAFEPPQGEVMKVLEGKNALVTGASKGIGAGIAKGLAEAGASVVVNYASDRIGADLVVAEIISKGGNAIAIQADISKGIEAKRLVAESLTALGSLDILVNNAGVYSFGPLESVTEEEFHRQFNTNVLGLLVITQEAAKHLEARDGGSIINVGTAASQAGAPNMVLYLATKSAVDSVTRVLSKELGPKKIRVNSINPGGTDTEGARTLGVIGSDFEKHLITQTPLGRLGHPDDIAPVAIFLASDASRWLTGEIILASGGAR